MKKVKATPLRVLGFDPGINFGAAVIEYKNGKWYYVDGACGKVPPKATMKLRIALLINQILNFVDFYTDDCRSEYCPYTAFEDIRVVRRKKTNAASVFWLNFALGYAIYSVDESQIDLVVPTEWKKAVTGQGNASKDEIRAAVEKQVKGLTPNLKQDIIDAIGIALWKGQQLKGGRYDKRP